ncbi:ComF family protein [Amycolatopsis sp. CA-128772]|uniref:ComF family protein n=1 Tax=Amycolatopsis sp. CA-128772 TaxID=2073159 RepID=UPI001E30FE9D|nr:ComF family protein [Amycolatopsis sp. CA-128772]
MVRVFALSRYRGVGRKLLIAYKERGRRDLAPSLGRVLAEALVELPLGVVVGGGPPAEVSPRVTGPRSAARIRAAPPISAGCPAPAGQVRVEPAIPPPLPSSHSAAQVPAVGHPQARPAPTTPPRALCLVPAPSRRSAARVRGGPHVERLAHAAANILATHGIKATVAPALELTGGVRDAVGLSRDQRIANLAGRLRFREAGRPPPGVPIVVLDDVVTTGATAAACARALQAEGFTVSAVLTLLAAG